MGDTASFFASQDSSDLQSKLAKTVSDYRDSKQDFFPFSFIEAACKQLNYQDIDKIFFENTLSQNHFDEELRRYADKAYLNLLTKQQKLAAQKKLYQLLEIYTAMYKKRYIYQSKQKQKHVGGLKIRNTELDAAKKTIKQCGDALLYLQTGINPAASSVEQYHNNHFHRWHNSSNCIAYIAKNFVDWLRDCTLEVLNNPTRAMRDFMSEINRHRLYWSMCGQSIILDFMLAAVPSSLNKTRASNEVNAPNPVTGYMSFILYYSRLFLNLTMLIKHTVPGWWMHDDEKKLGFSKRFSRQWDERGIAILNDVVWATVNLVTYFWLTSSQSVKMGQYGNGLTALLLGFDLALTYYAFKIDEKKHIEQSAAIKAGINKSEQQLAKLKRRLAATNKKLEDLVGKDNQKLTQQFSLLYDVLCQIELSHGLEVTVQVKDLLAKKLSDYQLRKKLQQLSLNDDTINILLNAKNNIINEFKKQQLNETEQLLASYFFEQMRLKQQIRDEAVNHQQLIKRHRDLDLEWKYKNKDHEVSLVYAFAMMLAFSTILLPYIPFFAPAAGAIAAASAILMFAFTIANTYKIYQNQVDKSDEEKRLTQKQIEQLQVEHQLLLYIKNSHKQTAKARLSLVPLENVYPEKEFLSKEQYYLSLYEDKSLSEDHLDKLTQQISLEIKQLEADTIYQQKMIAYHRANLIRSVAIDCLVPVVIFAATFFVPMGAGIGIMAAAFVIGVLSQVLIDKFFKPERKIVSASQGFFAHHDDWAANEEFSDQFEDDSIESEGGEDDDEFDSDVLHDVDITQPPIKFSFQS